MKPDNKAGGPWLYALGLVPVIWFALLIAPAISGGLSEIVNALPAAMNHPFKIVWCEDSVKTVLIFIAAYGLGIGIYLSSRRNYRRGEEHGSAKWGDPRAVNKKYRDKDPFKNRIFTQHVRMGLDLSLIHIWTMCIPALKPCTPPGPIILWRTSTSISRQGNQLWLKTAHSPFISAYKLQKHMQKRADWSNPVGFFHI